VLVEEHGLSIRAKCVEKTWKFVMDNWKQTDEADKHVRPTLIISVLSGKEPLSINQRSQRSILFDIVNAADEAKGEHFCQSRC